MDLIAARIRDFLSCNVTEGEPARVPNWYAARTPKHAVLTWLAIYPTVTSVSAVYDPAGLTDVALPVRTLALSIVVAPVVVFLVAPP